MKRIGISLIVMVTVASALFAQEFSASSQIYNRGSKSTSTTPNATAEAQKPVPAGAAYAIATQGPVMISPVADPKYGYGQAFFVRNPHSDPNVGGQFDPKRTDFDGIKLIGFDF